MRKMMKTTTMLCTAMAALTLASCSKNEMTEIPSDIVKNQNQISFNSSTGSTRAAVGNLEAVKSGFAVLGFKDGVTAVGDAFIDGQLATSTYQFDKVNNSWGWLDPAGKAWPEEATGDYPLTFYAEHPKAAITALSKQILMPLAMDAQTDLLVAKAEVTERPETGFANLNFKHILSNLVFKIETNVDYRVEIQSIRVVNTAQKGQTFDYSSMAYGAPEPNYQDVDLAGTDGTYNVNEGFFYDIQFGANGKTFEYVGANGKTVVAVPTIKNGIMMQMPQHVIPYWRSENITNGLGKFKEHADAWKGGTETDLTDKLDAWYTAAPDAANQPGMKGSAGWKGARIEVIYRIYDQKNIKSVVGRQQGETYTDATGAEVTATQDKFFRVGYPLDLSQIKKDGNPVGWENNKRYTYTIQMGTQSATNGILLDPDYKDENGSSLTPEKEQVENPKVDPGNPVTPGLINFIVDVDNWEADNTNIPVN